MTPAQLKSSILQLAIQGKLVPQIPGEGTGEELYQQIQKEKQALIKSGKIKKEKPLPPIAEDEIPFEIPEGWRWCRLGEISTKITDGTHHSPVNSEIGDYMYITAKNIKDNGVSLTNITYVSKDVHNEIYSRCNPEYNDVLLIKDGATTGVVTINNIIEPFSMLSSVALIKFTEHIHTWFIAFLLRSDMFNKSIRAGMKGTGITRITLTQIIPFVIPLPPLAEQRRIVAKIEALMPLIDRYDKAWTQIEAIQKKFPGDLKKSILQMAIQGKLVPQIPGEGTGEELYQQIQKEKQALIKSGKIKKEKPLPPIAEDEIPFEIPEGWRWCRLDDVCSKNIKRGKSPKYAAYSNTLVFAQKCNTKAGTIDLEIALFLDESTLSKYPEEEFMIDSDIIINSTGNGTLGRVGLYSISDNPKMIPLVPDSHVTIIRSSFAVSRKYIYYCLKYYQPYMEKLGSGSTNQIELSANTIKSLLFPLPPLAEQRRIVAKIEALMPLCDRLKKPVGLQGL